jgi:hypothetical protein
MLPVVIWKTCRLTTLLQNSIFTTHFTVQIKATCWITSPRSFWKYINFAYSQPSTLQFGDYIISAEVGVQQIHPLGALLFCIGLHPILSTTSSELTTGYMDNVTLGGLCADVAADVELFRPKVAKSVLC